MPFGEFLWELNEPLSTAHHMVGDESIPGVYDNISKLKLPRFRNGDRVACLYRDRKVVLSEPITGGRTLWNAAEAIERGLQRPINNQDRTLRSEIYACIANFLRSPDRLRLVQMYEAGTLRGIDLLGDYTGFCGSMHREKGGMWVYGLNS